MFEDLSRKGNKVLKNKTRKKPVMLRKTMKSAITFIVSNLFGIQSIKKSGLHAQYAKDGHMRHEELRITSFCLHSCAIDIKEDCFYVKD